LAAALAGAACSNAPTGTTATTAAAQLGAGTTAAPVLAPPATSGEFRYTVAQVESTSIFVFAEPGAAAPARELANPLPSGAPLTFLVNQEVPGWLEVHLPVRPNGSRGWVRVGDVSLTGHDFRVEVRLSEHTLAVFEGDEVLFQEPVGLGRSPTPTPGGLFYLLELIEPEDPEGPYGPFAFGLSGFSEELLSYRGGDGRLGLHGTDQPDLVGTDVSAGCLRVSNETIAQLSRLLPLGTPVVLYP
jgi:lipoprotein-anchoring transpeptidase ErfK/SrfK